MQYNFDEIIDRSNTQAMKCDYLPEKAPEGTLPLWVADMDFPCAQPIIDALHQRVDRLIYGYSFYHSMEVKQPVVDWFKRRFDWEINPNEMFFSPGVVPAMSFLLHALTEPGDGVIIQRPVYYPFTNQLLARGCQIANNALIYEDGKYSIDFADLEEKMADPNNKGMILCSPHNPVGRVWKPEELKQIVAIAQKYDKWIISDEIHCDLIRGGHQHYPLFKLCPEYSHRIIACTAPSKTFNIAGLQMSNIIIPNPEYQAGFMKCAYGEFSIASATPFGITAMMAAYTEGEEWLNQVNTYIDGNVDFVREFLKENLPKAHMVEPEGTYLLWIDLREYCSDAKELERLVLEEAGVALDEGYIFGEEGAGFERINIACSRLILKDCMERIAQVLQKLA